MRERVSTAKCLVFCLILVFYKYFRNRYFRKEKQRNVKMNYFVNFDLMNNSSKTICLAQLGRNLTLDIHLCLCEVLAQKVVFCMHGIDIQYYVVLAICASMALP